MYSFLCKKFPKELFLIKPHPGEGIQYYKQLEKNHNHRALFFAVLLHDIGKGRGGNHQEKGAKIAKKILIRLILWRLFL